VAAQSEPALRTLTAIRRAFQSAGETAIVAVEAPAGKQLEVAQQLRRLSRLAVDERVANTPVEPIRTVATSKGSAAALFLRLTGNGANTSSRHAVEALRQRLIPATVGRIRGLQTTVTGPTAE